MSKRRPIADAAWATRRACGSRSSRADGSRREYVEQRLEPGRRAVARFEQRPRRPRRTAARRSWRVICSSTSAGSRLSRRRSGRSRCRGPSSRWPGFLCSRSASTFSGDRAEATNRSGTSAGASSRRRGPTAGVASPNGGPRRRAAAARAALRQPADRGLSVADGRRCGLNDSASPPGLAAPSSPAKSSTRSGPSASWPARARSIALRRSPSSPETSQRSRSASTIGCSGLAPPYWLLHLSPRAAAQIGRDLVLARGDPEMTRDLADARLAGEQHGQPGSSQADGGRGEPGALGRAVNQRPGRGARHRSARRWRAAPGRGRARAADRGPAARGRRAARGRWPATSRWIVAVTVAEQARRRSRRAPRRSACRRRHGSASRRHLRRHDHRPTVDADAGLQVDAVAVGDGRLDGFEVAEVFPTAAHGANRVVLLGARVAEVDHHAVAVPGRGVAAVALDRGLDAALVGA